MAEAPAAALRLQLDPDALAATWRALDPLAGAARAGAAVKADGYGLGAAQVVPVLVAAGCADFFVAHSGEAAAVARHVAPAAITVLHGPLDGGDARYIKARGFRPAINSLRQARLWLDAGGGVCDIMVDTGINRLGLPLGALGDQTVRALDIEVLHSHLASADEDSPLNEVQRLRWEDARRALPHRRAALANSAGIVLGSAYHGDLTRPGLSLYGGWQRAELAPHIRQVAYPEAVLLQVRDIAAGEGVGYNATFVAPRSMRVGVISLGYADGYLRAWSGKGVFRHEGATLPVLGRVSMDMTVIDLTAAPALREGDWVRADYALPEASGLSGISQYELLTTLGSRFAR